MEHQFAAAAVLVALLPFLPLLDKKERVERVLEKEILEITIPRNFKKIDGSSIRFVPVRGVVTGEKKRGVVAASVPFEHRSYNHGVLETL